MDRAKMNQVVTGESEANARKASVHDAAILEAQLAECEAQVASLGAELDATNRGLVALHAELEASKESEAATRAQREVLAERERIGRDLHVRTIRQLFEVGIALQGVVRIAQPEIVAETIRDVVEKLDQTVREIRDTVLPLSDYPGTDPSR